MSILDLIEKRIQGESLSTKEINFIVSGFTDGTIKDYQMSAMAMTWVFKEMSPKEIADLTMAMMNSGEIYDLSSIKGIKVDKHSTGGVGDKVTIALGPIVAAAGVPIAKMSGRGLGFTGGTVDKLESIPGYKIETTKDELIKQVNEIGLAIIGQTDTMVPADKKIYALRDVSGTVASYTAIVSSIMSKKLATGSDAILLDVKCGNGAFMKTYKEAEHLAKSMISIGKELNKDVRAEITSMERPIGRAIGNKNEVIEAMNTLQGKGPEDFTELIYSSSATILEQAKIVSSHEEGLAKVKEIIQSGAALKKFKEWISYQGGDVEAIFKKDFWNPKYKVEVKAKEKGYFIINSAVDFGVAALKLGAGREVKTDIIDNEAGIYLNKKTNEEVEEGQVMFTLCSSNEINEDVIKSLQDAYSIKKDKIENKLILGKLR